MNAVFLQNALLGAALTCLLQFAYHPDQALCYGDTIQRQQVTAVGFRSRTKPKNV